MCVLLAVQADNIGAEAGQSDSLTAVIESMGIYDTDLRARDNTSAVSETQRLLKILLTTLDRAVTQGLVPGQANHGESSATSGMLESVLAEAALGRQTQTAPQTNYTQVTWKRSVLKWVYLVVFRILKNLVSLGGYGL